MADGPKLWGRTRNNDPNPNSEIVQRFVDQSRRLNDMTGSILRSAGIAVSEALMTISRGLRVEGTFESTGTANIGGELNVTGPTELAGDASVTGDLRVTQGRVTIESGGGLAAQYPSGAAAAFFGPLRNADGTNTDYGLLIQEDGTPGGIEGPDIFRARQSATDGKSSVIFGQPDSAVDSAFGYSNTWYFEARATGTLTAAPLWLHSADEIRLTSETGRLVVPWVGTSGSANTVIGADNVLMRSSSARKYKQDIEDLDIDPAAVLKMQPRSWRDRGEVERDPEATARYVGFIAEELDEIGLGAFVTRDQDGEVEGIAYDRLVAAVIPVLRDLNDRVTDLESARSARP